MYRLGDLTVNEGKADDLFSVKRAREAPDNMEDLSRKVDTIV